LSSKFFNNFSILASERSDFFWQFKESKYSIAINGNIKQAKIIIKIATAT